MTQIVRQGVRLIKYLLGLRPSGRKILTLKHLV